MEEKLNRIGKVMKSQGRTGRWLADQLQVRPYTVSRWVQNHQQPSLKTLFEIAKLLGVDVCELLERG